MLNSNLDSSLVPAAVADSGVDDGQVSVADSIVDDGQPAVVDSIVDDG